jgi:hypothetical protein
MRHMRRTLASAACAGLIMSPVTGAAQSIWFDLTVPGSLEELLGTADGSLEGPHLLRSLIGAFHDPTGTIANPAQPAGAFRDCLGDVQRLRDRWRAVERAAGEVSLPAAAAAADGGRRALEAFLDLFDLRLAGGGSDQRVAPNRAEARSRQAEETEDQGLPAVCGTGGGWESAEIERRLNAGETIAWDLPHFEVSLPLSPRVWLQVLYGDDPGAGAAERAAERAADLVGRLVTDPRAAQFYAGLAALDDATLTWLQTHPRALSRLAGEHLTTFAQYGGGLRVQEGAVMAPGGAAFWEALVGVPVTEPERFMNRLFASEQAANAYDLVTRLPESSRRFVTGAGQPDPRDWRRGLALLGRVIETLPLPDPRFAERGDARDPDLVFTPRPGLRFGDRLNENICNLPDDEAVVLMWYAMIPGDMGAVGTGRDRESWYACGPMRCTPTGQPNQLAALEFVHNDRRGGVFEFACQVEAVMDFPLDAIDLGGPAGTGESSNRTMVRPASMYRLGYPLTGQDQDARQFIVR